MSSASCQLQAHNVLPHDTTEAEAEEAIAATIQEARQDIEQRHAQKELAACKTQLVQQGIGILSEQLTEMKNRHELSVSECYDSDLRQHLETVTRRTLESELTGHESNKEIRDLIREIVEHEI